MTQDSIIFGHKGNDTRTSGLLESHYAPKARVLLNKPASFGDGFIALHNIPTPEGSIRLGKPIDVEAFARDLYSSLRKGDNLNLSTIIVILPETGELKDAIKDRMIKASFH
jgi:L-threonylcarbamoyladenylate synthase